MDSNKKKIKKNGILVCSRGIEIFKKNQKEVEGSGMSGVKLSREQEVIRYITSVRNYKQAYD